MHTRNIKTIQISVKEWLDKASGNRYFGGYVSVNYGLKNQTTIPIPFQYGNSDQYIYEGLKLVKEQLKCFKRHDIVNTAVLRHEGIKLLNNKIENQTKKAVIDYSTGQD